MITELEAMGGLARECRLAAYRLASETNDGVIAGLLLDIESNIAQIDSSLLKLVKPEVTNG